MTHTEAKEKTSMNRICIQIICIKEKKIQYQFFSKLVGLPGFEPGTYRVRIVEYFDMPLEIDWS